MLLLSCMCMCVSCKTKQKSTEINMSTLNLIGFIFSSIHPKLIHSTYFVFSRSLARSFYYSRPRHRLPYQHRVFMRVALLSFLVLRSLHINWNSTEWIWCALERCTFPLLLVFRQALNRRTVERERERNKKLQTK